MLRVHCLASPYLVIRELVGSHGFLGPEVVLPSVLDPDLLPLASWKVSGRDSNHERRKLTIGSLETFFPLPILILFERNWGLTP